MMLRIWQFYQYHFLYFVVVTRVNNIVQHEVVIRFEASIRIGKLSSRVCCLLEISINNGAQCLAGVHRST